MQIIRILADDITGALDTAACFCGDVGAIAVSWDAAPSDGSLGFSSESRDVSESEAIGRARRHASLLRGENVVAFKKIDSLLRGHPGAEIAAILQDGGFDLAIIAPAIPVLGRMTRGGRQWLRKSDGALEPVGVDLRDDLIRFGIAVSNATADLQGGGGPRAVIADADNDADLECIVAAGRKRKDRILWCGTAGLATALARSPAVAIAVQAERLLLVCGTEHPVAREQIAAIAEKHPDGVVRMKPGAERIAYRRVDARLQSGGWAALVADLSGNFSSDEAQSQIRRMLLGVLPHLQRPDAFFVMGGETARSCCDALQSPLLRVCGLYEPGLPVSVLEGGLWAGTTMLSKSGAFGSASTVFNLIERVHVSCGRLASFTAR